MKKTFFDPASLKFVTRVGLPKIQSRRMGMSSTESHRNTAYKSEGGTGDDKRTEEELITEIMQRVQSALDTRATKEEIAGIIQAQKEGLTGTDIIALRSLADDKSGVMAIVMRQGLELQRLAAEGAKKPEDMSIRGQIASWQTINKEAISHNLSGKHTSGVQMTPLNIRVASPMTPATVNATPSPYIGSVEIETGITALVRRKPVFWDYITKGRTGAENYVWVNETNPLGEAAWLAPGELKPGVSLALEAENSHAKKIAVSAKAAMELFQDIEGMVTFIETEMKYKLNDKINATLMSNAGSSTTPKGIQNYAVAYTLTDIQTTNPNYMDAIRAVIAQLEYSWLGGAVTVFINPIDAANMDLQKASDSGVYMLPPFSTSDGRSIAGATIVQDRNIAIGSLLAAKLDYYKVLIYQDFMMKWGWENDDFTRNLSTAIAEMRMHQFVKTIHEEEGVFVYDTFANVVAAITTAP